LPRPRSFLNIESNLFCNSSNIFYYHIITANYIGDYINGSDHRSFPTGTMDSTPLQDNFPLSRIF